MRNLSEEIIEFFKNNEYIQRVEEIKNKNPKKFADNISEEMQELFHKLIEFKNRFKDQYARNARLKKEGPT